MNSKRNSDGINVADLIGEVRDQIRGLWRFRWPAIGLAWISCLVAWYFVSSMPDVYESSARLHIDSEDSRQSLLDGLIVQSDLLLGVNVLIDSILSRPTLEEIADRSGYDLGNPSEAEAEALVRRLANGLVLDLDRNQILTVSFEHADPKVAHAVVEVLIDVFIESLLGANRSDTTSAQSFLERKLMEYETLLLEAENRLAEFKKRNVGQMPGESGGYYSRLQREMENLRTIELQVKLARQRSEDLARQLAGEQPVFGLMATKPVGEASPQVRLLEAELAQLRLSFTDEHPDVVRVQEQLDRLREQAGERMPTTSSYSGDSIDMNPVYQQLKIQANQAELDLSQMNSQYFSQKKMVDDLQKKIDTIPMIEAELVRLNRAYDVNKAQHSQLLERLETARLSEDVGTSNTGMQFRLIEPPIQATSPTGPNRGFFVTMALLVSLAVGIGVALLLSIVSPVIYSTRKLEQLFDLPVLGAITRVYSPEEILKARYEIAKLAGTFVVLLGVYATILILDPVTADLASQFADMIR